MSQQIIEALADKFTESSVPGGFHTLNGGRIYEGMAPLNSQLPHSVFNCVVSTPERFFDGSVSQTALIQVDMYGKRELGADFVGEIEQSLFDLLEGTVIPVENHDRGVCTILRRSQRTIEDDAIRIMDEVEVRCTHFQGVT